MPADFMNYHQPSDEQPNPSLDSALGTVYPATNSDRGLP